MRTLTVKSGGGGGSFTEGWHLVTIKSAEYGKFEDNQYIDIYFDEYPDTFNLRTYANHSKDNGEEFAIGRIFRFANAGICEVSKSDDGEALVSIDDDPVHLTGKQVWVFLYPDGKYHRALNRVAPTEFSNQLETFSEKDVEYWKSNAEDYYNKYVANKTAAESQSWGETDTSVNGEVTEGSWKDIQSAVEEAQNDGIPG